MAEKSEFSQIEEKILKLWEKENTFARSLEQRKGEKLFSFYDGPPFANGLPHYGHVVPGTIKDAIARYKTMRGYYVPRKAGWDTHGLPVEYDVEKQLKISGKQDILKLGVDKFNKACRDSAFRYKGEFEDFIRRTGRWIDLENAYSTLDDDYIESVWWVFAELYKKGLVQRGFRSMPYCPRCATPLSNFELNQGYQDGIEDPSVYVMFPLTEKLNTAFVAWTTTPWTLPANAALAVDPKATYVTAEMRDGQKLILAKDRLDVLDLGKREYKVLKTQQGKELVGLRYEPLYHFYPLSDEEKKTVNLVYGDASVDLEEGTGILHVAPRYGETDLEMGLREGLPLIESVDKFGRMSQAMGPFAGLFFKAADEPIIADLTHRNRVFAAETFTHTYPFCWRCETPLMYFATPSWLVKVSELRDKLVKNNKEISWVPAHIKKGRFGNWLAEARDWGISRNRFWGAPLPIWVNEADEEDLMVLSSIAELKKMSGKAGFDMHRPGIDAVVIKKGGKTYRRTEEVFDCWFESGAMPYAQGHYPFEGKQEFKDAFPADFISEGLDQTRGWFYTLHVLGTALFNKPAYRNVVCHGIVVAADGRKLSKRLRNYPPLDEVFDTYGADTLRFFMLTSPVVSGEEIRFSTDHLKEVQRNVFMTFMNAYRFFRMYADVDKWVPHSSFSIPHSDNILDRWMLARLGETIAEVTDQADAYQIAKATRPIRGLIEDLSNWYIRRSRRRFWSPMRRSFSEGVKSKNDNDKAYAYQTLHYVLIRTCQLLAPWAPFLSDHIYRELVGSTKLPKSVHLCEWPEVEAVEKILLQSMNSARDTINEALSQRARAKVKVRQPLASVDITTTKKVSAELLNIIAEEVNVKAVRAKVGKSPKVRLNTKLTPELLAEGRAREAVRCVQAARKAAGLNVADRISLELSTADKILAKSLRQFSDYIAAETLASKIKIAAGAAKAGAVKVDGRALLIKIKRSG